MPQRKCSNDTPTDDYIFYKEKEKYYCFTQNDIPRLLKTEKNPYTGNYLSISFINDIKLIRKYKTTITELLTTDVIERKLEKAKNMNQYINTGAFYIDFIVKNMSDWASYLETKEGGDYYKRLSSDSQLAMGFLFSVAIEQGTVKPNLIKKLGIVIPNQWLDWVPFVTPQILENLEKTISAVAVRIFSDKNAVSSIFDSVSNYVSSTMKKLKEKIFKPL